MSKLIKRGVTIYTAYTNILWPGKASVIVHQIHMAKAKWNGPVKLNNSPLPFISSYLDDMALGSPEPLKENAGRMFQGTILNGEGFKITEELAHELVRESHSNTEIVFPFIGGSEVNSDPLLRPMCWVINFWDWPEEKATRYARAFAILEEHVKPERTRKKPNGEFQLRKPLPERWWQHGEKRPALYHAVRRGLLFENHPDGWSSDKQPMERVLVVSRGVTKYPGVQLSRKQVCFFGKAICPRRRQILSVQRSIVRRSRNLGLVTENIDGR